MLINQRNQEWSSRGLESRKIMAERRREGLQFARIATFRPKVRHRGASRSMFLAALSFFCVATNPDAASMSDRWNAPEFREGRVRRDKFYLTLLPDERTAKRERTKWREN